jgi:glycosyltransferase involved in cell wall biosynthesis
MSGSGLPHDAERQAARPVAVVHVLARDALAGTELMVAALAEHSDPALVRTTVVLLDRPGPVAERLAAAGVPVLSLGGGAGALVALARHVRRHRIDVLCGYGFRTGLATRVLARALSPATSVVTGVRGLYVTEIERLDSPRGRLVMAVERATTPLVDAYVANSAGALDVLAAHGVDRARLRWIPNGIDAGRWPLPDRTGRADPPTVLCVGRFIAIKRQADLVEAAALLRARGVRARFVFAGTGPTLGAVQARVRALDLTDDVAFLGGCTPERVAQALADADVACLVSSQEGMPGAVMEAMASALPVVGTRVNGIADLVRDGETGLLVPPADPAALAAALERLVGDTALRQALGAAGRRHIVAEHSLTRMVTTTTALYRDLVLSRRGTP